MELDIVKQAPLLEEIEKLIIHSLFEIDNIYIYKIICRKWKKIIEDYINFHQKKFKYAQIDFVNKKFILDPNIKENIKAIIIEGKIKEKVNIVIYLRNVDKINNIIVEEFKFKKKVKIRTIKTYNSLFKRNVKKINEYYEEKIFYLYTNYNFKKKSLYVYITDFMKISFFSIVYKNIDYIPNLRYIIYQIYCDILNQYNYIININLDNGEITTEIGY